MAFWWVYFLPKNVEWLILTMNISSKVVISIIYLKSHAMGGRLKGYFFNVLRALIFNIKTFISIFHLFLFQFYFFTNGQNSLNESNSLFAINHNTKINLKECKECKTKFSFGFGEIHSIYVQTSRRCALSRRTRKRLSAIFLV